MLFKKVIPLVLLLAMVPFVIGPTCLTVGLGGGSSSGWRFMIRDSLQTGLDSFYGGQMDDIFALAGWVNDNAEYQGMVQLREGRVLGEENLD